MTTTEKETTTTTRDSTTTTFSPPQLPPSLPQLDFDDSPGPMDRVGCVFNAERATVENLGSLLLKFNLELCNHYTYHTAWIDPTTWEVTPIFSTEDTPQKANGFLPMYQRFVDRVSYKKRNSGITRQGLLKVSERSDSEAFSKMMAVNPLNGLQVFVHSVIKTLRIWGFDGVALDWVIRNQADRPAFNRLVSELRGHFEREDSDTDMDRLLLAVYVGGPTDAIQDNYNVPILEAYADQINVYYVDDVFDPYIEATLWNPLLYPESYKLQISSGEIPPYRDYMRGFFDPLDPKLERWISLGANRSKLNVVFSLTAHGYELADPLAHNFGDQVVGPFPIRDEGRPDFNQICRQIRDTGRVFRPSGNDDPTPVWLLGRSWMSFDDPISLQIKVTHLRQRGIKGVLLEYQDQDDIDGEACGRARSRPLLMTGILYLASEMAKVEMLASRKVSDPMMQCKPKKSGASALRSLVGGQGHQLDALISLSFVFACYSSIIGI